MMHFLRQKKTRFDVGKYQKYSSDRVCGCKMGNPGVKMSITISRSNSSLKVWQEIKCCFAFWFMSSVILSQS